MRQTYFTGKPCVRGHVAHRYISNRCCVECNLIRAVKWAGENSELKRQYDAEWSKTNPKKKATRQRWERANKRKRSDWQKSRRSENPELTVMKDRIKNARHTSRGVVGEVKPRTEVCECCGKPEWVKHKTGTLKSLALDHCHTSGKFRGWLCVKCNTGIGKLGDNLDGLMKAVEYLRRVNG